MEVVKMSWYWGPMSFHVLPVPTTPVPTYNSYLPIRLLRCMDLPYAEYISGIAAIETQAGDAFPASPLASSCSTYGLFGSSILTPSSRGFGASAFEGTRTTQRDFSSRFMEHPEWYKNLDFRDTIFIPSLCTDDPPRPHHADDGLQPQAVSSSQVPPQHVTSSAPLVIGSKVDSWQVIPHPSSISMNEHMININKLRPLSLPPHDDRRLSFLYPSAGGIPPSNQSRAWRTPPSSQIPLTPPSSTAWGSRRTSPDTQHIGLEIMAEQGRINKQHGSGSSQRFIPSRVVLERSLQVSVYPDTPQPSPTRPGRNAKYYGRADIPMDQNCAIYITGIPARAEYADVLSSIRGGKIYACLMDPPDEGHPTSAAKIVFFTRASAELFMQRHHTFGVYILSQRIQAVWNRIRYSAHTRPHQSRVINITGPAKWMDFTFFEDFFKKCFDFDKDERYEKPCPRKGYAVHVWKFACLRAQAESAKIAVEREFGGVFKVEYGLDPCAEPWS